MADLAHEMLRAVDGVILGRPQEDIAYAAARFAAALLSACAKPGQERAALLAGADYLARVAERVDETPRGVAGHA